jgi:hypothetical protein
MAGRMTVKHFLVVMMAANTLTLRHKSLHSYIWTNQGRAVAEAVSRWLPTAAARVRSRV